MFVKLRPDKRWRGWNALAEWLGSEPKFPRWWDGRWWWRSRRCCSCRSWWRRYHMLELEWISIFEKVIEETRGPIFIRLAMHFILGWQKMRMWNISYLLSADKKLMSRMTKYNLRFQFHQRFKQSFCARRSQKCQKTRTTWMSFFIFVIWSSKSGV